MRISKDYVTKYFVENFLKENWEEIIGMIGGSINDWGEFGEQIVNELKKYEVNYVSFIEKKEFIENEEE